MAEPHTHHEDVGIQALGAVSPCFEMVAEYGHRLARTARADQVKPAESLGPLREMRVTIP